MRRAVILLPVVAFAGGWWFAPKDLLDSEVEQTGFLQTDTRHILSATVESLRRERKLLVLLHKGTVDVDLERRWLWLFHGEQRLIVAGVVPYHVDLAGLTYTYDDETGQVVITLPPVTLGDIALHPEQAVTLNGGILTYSQSEVDELLRANYAQARRALTAQAQGFRWLAEERARAEVGAEVRRALAGTRVTVIVR